MNPDLQFYNLNISNIEIQIIKQALRLYIQHDRYYLQNCSTKQQVLQQIDQLINDLNQFRKYAKIKQLTNQSQLFQHKIEHMFAILSVTIGSKVNNWEDVKKQLIDYKNDICNILQVKYISYDQLIDKYKQIVELIKTKQPYKIYKQIIQKL